LPTTYTPPLAVIQLYTRMALRQARPEEPLWGDMQQVQKRIGRATVLIDQLLSFGRQEIAEPRTLNLNEVLDTLSQTLRQIISADVQLVTALGENLWTVYVDPSQMEHVIVSLVINACDAMPEGGDLTIETANVALDDEYVARRLDAQTGEHVMLVVSDTGVGMEGEVKSHLFEPFFTTKEPGQGTGLGLATVYGIITQNGGHIHVHSEVGRGTTFDIYLPRGEQAEIRDSI